MIDRRTLVAGSLLCACGSRAAAQMVWPGGTNGATGKPPLPSLTPENAKIPVGGCGLTGPALRAFASRYRISREFTFSDDTKVQIPMEIAISNFRGIGPRHFGVRPIFGFYDDSKPSHNAFATPFELFDDYRHPDGTVVFGNGLLTDQLALGSSAASAIMVVLAHEHAHILQFKRQRGGACPDTELEADYLAGWALGSEAMSKSNLQVDPVAMAQEMFSIGDYDFNSRDHHGTPMERMRAVTIGYRDGYSGSDLEAAYEKATGIDWRS